MISFHYVYGLCVVKRKPGGGRQVLVSTCHVTCVHSHSLSTRHALRALRALSIAVYSFNYPGQFLIICPHSDTLTNARVQPDVETVSSKCALMPSGTECSVTGRE